MNAEDFDAIRFIRQRNFKNFIESTRSKQGRVNKVRPIGRSYYHDPMEFLETIKLGKQLRYYAFCHVRIPYVASCWCYGLNLIKENNARSCLAGLPEDFPNSFFGLPHPL